MRSDKADGEEQPTSDSTEGGDVASYSDPIYSTPEFRMYAFKVLTCSNRQAHDWASCPFMHPGEKAARRDLRVYNYSAVACPDVQRGSKCPRGARCSMAHSVFEYWLHPQRYRTLFCRDGEACSRKASCFFAHTADELRVVPGAPPGGDQFPPKYSCKPYPATSSAAAGGSGAKAAGAAGQASMPNIDVNRASSNGSSSRGTSLPGSPTSTAAGSTIPSRSDSLGRGGGGIINTCNQEGAAAPAHVEPSSIDGETISSNKPAAPNAVADTAAAAAQDKFARANSSSADTGTTKQQPESSNTNKAGGSGSTRQQQGIWPPAAEKQRLAPATPAAGMYNSSSNSGKNHTSLATIISNLEEEAALNRQRAAAAQAAADYWMTACCTALTGVGMHTSGSAVEDLLAFPISDAAQFRSATLPSLGANAAALGPLTAGGQSTLACFNGGLPTLQQACSSIDAPAQLPFVAGGVQQAPEALLLLLAQQQQQQQLQQQQLQLQQQQHATQAMWPGLAMEPDVFAGCMIMPGSGSAAAPVAAAAGSLLAMPAASTLAPLVRPAAQAVASTAQGLPMALAGYNMPAASAITAAAGPLPAQGACFQPTFLLM